LVSSARLKRSSQFVTKFPSRFPADFYLYYEILPTDETHPEKAQLDPVSDTITEEEVNIELTWIADPETQAAIHRQDPERMFEMV
jgi:hypothetical protein